MQLTLQDAAGPPGKSRAISSQDHFGAPQEVSPLLLTQMVLLTWGDDSLSEDGLVVNLWLAKSKILYLSVEFLYVHGINLPNRKGSLNSLDLPGELQTIMRSSGRIRQVSLSGPQSAISWAGQNHIKVVQTGDEQDQVTLLLVTSLTPLTAKVVPHSCGRRAWARVPSLSSLLWQTQKWRTARGSFSRNCISLYKAKSLKSLSWVIPTRELGHCLQRNFREFWGRRSQMSASASPPLPWTDCPNNFSLPLALKSILPCGKSPVLSFQTGEMLCGLPILKQPRTLCSLQDATHQSAHQSPSSSIQCVNEFATFRRKLKPCLFTRAPATSRNKEGQHKPRNFLMPLFCGRGKITLCLWLLERTIDLFFTGSGLRW